MPTGLCALALPENMATYIGAPDSPGWLARAAPGLCGTGCDAALHSSSWSVRINRAGRNDQAEYVAIFTRVSTKPPAPGAWLALSDEPVTSARAGLRAWCRLGAAQSSATAAHGASGPSRWDCECSDRQADAGT